jgi:hypothetical protein
MGLVTARSVVSVRGLQSDEEDLRRIVRSFELDLL